MTVSDDCAAGSVRVSIGFRLSHVYVVVVVILWVVILYFCGNLFLSPVLHLQCDVSMMTSQA